VKVVAISDTHRQHRSVKTPECDVLIHAGDIGWEGWGKGGAKCFNDFFGWMDEQPAKNKIFISGNHDWISYRESGLVKEKAEKHGIHYLCDDETIIDGLKFWGSPRSLEFCGWAFSIPREEDAMRRQWDKIPNDTDVLITHGPPIEIQDFIVDIIDDEPLYSATKLGDPILRERVFEVKPKVHIFGHIHGGAGQTKIDDIRFVNASVCTEDYEPTNWPIIIEV